MNIRKLTTLHKFSGEARRDDGVAMIIVLTIIFVMSTLGGVALLATLTNMRMSAKYAGWTSEYYELDRDAEERLSLLDSRLSAAEGYAYEYLRSEYYRVAEGAPSITGEGATDINEKAQDFIYNTWYNDVYIPSLTAVSEGGAVIPDESRYNNLFARFNSEFYQRLYYYFSYRLISRDVRDGLFDSIELSPMMAGFAGMLENYMHDSDGMKVVIGVTDGNAEYAKHVTVNALVTAPVFGFETRTEDVPFRANPIWSGALTARGSIRFIGGEDTIGGIPAGGGRTGGTAGSAPDEGAPSDTTQSEAVPSEGVSSAGAPLVGVSSAGVPLAGANANTNADVVRVYGDVISVDYNEYFINQNDWASLEGNEYGVASAGAAVEIYGNVYSRGDMHIIRDGGSIAVRRYQTNFSSEYKKGIFANTLYFDTTPVPVMIQRHTQPENGRWERDFIPFFYRDHLGGNVYCNNLAIGRDVLDGSIFIENGPIRGGEYDGMSGVVWTLDDVHNKGRNSRIRIEGNLIGISSDATFDDHTESSAVINNHFDSGTIELMGAIVMPGTAFMKFDGVNDMMDENTFFETAESVSASNTEILTAYMQKPTYEPDVLYFFDRYILFTERGASDFFIVHYEFLYDKIWHLVNRLSGNIPETGIITKSSFEGYTRGAVIGRDASGKKMMFGPPGFGEIDGYNEIVNYSENRAAYNEIKDSLKTAYKLKTESFGAAGYKFGDFIKLTALLDPAGRLYPELEGAITFIIGDSVLELEGEQSGIVYCAAAMDGSLPILTVRGDGSFRGTIISEGDIYIEGSPVIHYDEKLISKILLQYPEIRDFFSPGEMGETSHVRILGVSQGMKKLVRERYRVTGWSQWQE